tara:strand:+ start:4523 stop:5215 length:693 start_codon:yes stop_codon:yes gene_type:complete
MLGLGNVLGRGGAPAEFTPASISSLIHWWKHNTGIEEADGTSPPGDGEDVVVWNDSKGDQHAATSVSNKPTYDATEESVVFGTATNSLLTLPGGDVTLTDFSMYCRVKFVNFTTSDKIIIDSSASSSMFWRVTNTTTSRLKISNQNKNFTVPTMSTGGTYNIGIERNSSNEIRLYVDGIESSTGTLSSTDAYTFDTIGGCVQDHFKTLIICNKALTSVERINLNTYLDKI